MTMLAMTPVPPDTGSGPRTDSGFDRPVQQSPAATTAEIDGQLVALDMNSGTCFGLNRVATRVWQLIATPASPRQIVTVLLGEYDVDPQTCAEQVASLVNELVEISLAVPVL
ncbi:MAG: hypothetical protein RIS94_972 [Pseudomonadota bacterium]|jgi:hypothetical protein